MVGGEIVGVEEIHIFEDLIEMFEERSGQWGLEGKTRIWIIRFG